MVEASDAPTDLFSLGVMRVLLLSIVRIDNCDRLPLFNFDRVPESGVSGQRAM
jgi:hypothetical protein